MAESNLNFLHRNQSSSQSPLDRHLNFQHHHRHHHSLDASGSLSHELPSNKRVKLEVPDEESNSSSCVKAAEGAEASEEYFCRNTAGGGSVIKQQQLDAISSGGGGANSSGTDNEDNNDASSTENYEPLDFKAWRSQRPPVACNSNDEDDEDDDYSIGRASLTVEVGPATSASRLVDANSAADYLTPAVHSAK